MNFFRYRLQNFWAIVKGTFALSFKGVFWGMLQSIFRVSLMEFVWCCFKGWEGVV